MITEAPILSQPAFYLAFTIPLFWSMIVFFISFKNIHISLDLDGMNKIYQNSQFPFMIMWISIPLMALVASIHRAKLSEIQLSKVEQQIKMSEIKNNAELFLSHYEFYSKSIKETVENVFNEDKSINLLYFSKKEAYMNIFKGSSIKNGISEISIDFFEMQIKEFNNVHEGYLSLYSKQIKGETLCESQIVKLRNGLTKIMNRIGINVESQLISCSSISIDRLHNEILMLISLLDILIREFRYELGEELCCSYLKELPRTQRNKSHPTP